MTAEGHLLFALATAVAAKRYDLTPIISAADWWHLIPACLLTSLLPDIDHPRSLLGQRLRWISLPISRIFGHRGFTHSLIAVAIGVFLLINKLPANLLVPNDVIQGMVLGYLSHILADMLTPAGVPLLWPCRWRFRLPILPASKHPQPERYFCIALLTFTVLTPESLTKQWITVGSQQMNQTWQQWSPLLLRFTH
ncbi:metal-dependent hydrolase [Rosenbergiella sp. S61]|uniref:Metal-dependent hydrolase n=1 Tax=Rosenbergiella gaditana TaxID=2726987 RepID=A0ABS5ST21_9GAMM|nr:metal-dependent hydrolase [Rosenbergiella gaditana]MBT0723230.1 metal-dependent hydrolase [Rosenbergiella gaditana]